MLVLDQHFAGNFFVQYWSMLILIKLLIIFLCKFICGLCKVNFFEQCWPRQIKITLHRLFSCNKVPVYCGEKWRKVSLYLISPSLCTLSQRKLLQLSVLFFPNNTEGSERTTARIGNLCPSTKNKQKTTTRATTILRNKVCCLKDYAINPWKNRILL